MSEGQRPETGPRQVRTGRMTPDEAIPRKSLRNVGISRAGLIRAVSQFGAGEVLTGFDGTQDEALHALRTSGVVSFPIERD